MSRKRLPLSWSRTAVVLAALLLGGTAVLAKPPAIPHEIRSRLHLASELLREKRYEEALELFQQLAQRYAHIPKVVTGQKTCLLELKRYDEVRTILQRELATRPDDPSLLEQLGTLAAREGDRAAAYDWWRRIVEVQEGSRGSYLALADLLTRNRMLDEALATYAEADSVHPGRFTRQKAALHELRFEFVPATEEYLNLLESMPTSLSFVEGRLLRIGENEEGLAGVIERVEARMKAVQEAERAAEEAPEETSAEDGVARPPNFPALGYRKLLGDLYLEAGDHESARREYFRLLDAAPENFASLLVFGKRCQTDGEHATAIRVFERVLADHPQARAAPSALMEIVRSQMELARWDQALVTCRRLVESYPETDFALDARLRTGEILLRGKRQPAEAEAVFRQLIALGRGPWEEAAPQFGVAECALWAGELERAYGVFGAIGSRQFGESTRERALYERARTLFYQGELARADSLFKRVAEDFPRGLHVNDALEFSILINTNPDDPETLGRYAEARLSLRRDRPATAALELERLESEVPEAAILDEALILLGRAYRASGRSRDALAALARAVDAAQVMDRAADATLLRADILAHDLGDTPAALAEYESLLLAYPETLAADRARDLTGDLKRALP